MCQSVTRRRTAVKKENSREVLFSLAVGRVLPLENNAIQVAKSFRGKPPTLPKLQKSSRKRGGAGFLAEV